MGIERWTDAVEGAASGVERFMASAEAVLVSVVGRVACWLTPLPSAVLVSRAAGRVFGLAGIWTIIMAAVVELVGLVTSNLWLTAREWNRTKRKSDPAANEHLAVSLMVGYFITTVALLLAFEIPNIVETGDYAGLTSLLFPGLSAVGVIALNERVTHHRRMAEVARDKRERRDGRRSGQRQKEAEAVPLPEPVRRVKSAPLRDRARAVLELNPGVSGEELGRLLDCSGSWGRRLKRELSSEDGREPTIVPEHL